MADTEVVMMESEHVDSAIIDAAAVDTDDEKYDEVKDMAAEGSAVGGHTHLPPGLPTIPQELAPAASEEAKPLIRGPVLVAKPALGGRNDSGNRVSWVSMVETKIRQPTIRMRLYGRGDSGSDLLTLYHNAMKREIQDLYFMLACMSKRETSLEAAELVEFGLWFDLFSKYVTWYLGFEQSEMFPYAQKILTQGNNANAANIKHTEETLAKKALVETNMVECLNYLQANGISMDGGMLNKAPEDPDFMTGLVKKMDAFVEPLLEILIYEEKEIIPLLSGKLTNAEKLHFESETFRMMHNLSIDGHMHFHIILRAMKQLESNEANKLRQRYLGLYSAFSMKNRKVNKEYEDSRELFRRKHLDPIHNSHHRWNGVASDRAKFGLQEVGMERENSGFQGIFARRKSKGSSSGTPSRDGSKVVRKGSLKEMFARQGSSSSTTQDTGGVGVT